LADMRNTGSKYFDNLTFLRDNLPQSNGALLSIDQANAFPNVDHEYMSKVLQAFGFPLLFCHFIITMYTDIFVHINTGSSLTQPIKFQKGVKQGDPMANSLFVLCIEPLLRRASRRMLEVAPSPFPNSPNTNISAYADDTIPIISNLEQLKVIEEELYLYGKFSGGRVNFAKCEIYPFGNWSNLHLETEYQIRMDGLKILGIWFGKNQGEMWDSLIVKLKSKLELYKLKSTATSLMAKTKILNTFVLPILWYALKVLDPPPSFCCEVERISELYLWDNRRHWVRRSVVYAPVGNGGLGLKSPRVQMLIFRLRMIEKSFNPNCSKYFLKECITQCRSLVLKNEVSQNPFYEITRSYLKKINFMFRSMPPNLLSEIYIQNQLIFGKQGYHGLSSLGLLTVGQVEEFIQNETPMELREPTKRKIYAEIQSFKFKIRAFRESLEENKGVDEEQKILFRVFDPLEQTTVAISKENGYITSYFGIFTFDSLSSVDKLKLKSKKWERLKGTKLSTTEIDIVWRIWNNSIITFKIASLMKLLSNGSCPYCNLVNPNCTHLVFCSSTKLFWDFIWALFMNMKIQITKKEALFGYDDEPLVNSILFLALVVIYRRFLFNVNSGKTDYDLIKVYKQVLYEKIYIEYIVAKSNHALASFSESWGNGAGLFRINAESLDIRM